MATGLCLTCKQNAPFTVDDSAWPQSEHYSHKVMWKQAPQTNVAISKPETIVKSNDIQTGSDIVQSIAENIENTHSDDVRLVRASMASIGNIIFERELMTKQMFCALIAQKSMIIYGGPGTAKSDLSNVFSESVDRSYWGTTISAFTSLEDLFGAYDLMKMRDEGVWERRKQGMLTHEVIFLDELGNASSPIRDAVKEAINERTYTHGDVKIALPMQMLIAASNSKLLDLNSTEEAFADRFIIRTIAAPMQEDKNVVRMLTQMYDRPLVERIEGSIITRLQSMIREVEFSRAFLESAQALRKQIVGDPASGIEHDITHRRLKQTMHLVAAHALLAGRKRANRSDLTVFGWTFWNDPENEERPLAEWLKVHLTSQMTYLEAVRGEVDSIRQSWLDQKNSEFAPATTELMQIGLQSQGRLNMITNQVTGMRPKLEDQDETDLANLIEKEIKQVGAEIMSEVYNYSQTNTETQSVLLDDLKKG